MKSMSYLIMILGGVVFIGGFINGPEGGLTFFAIGIAFFISGLFLFQSDKNGPDNSVIGPVGTRACPYCAEPVKVKAIKCKHCGSTIEPGIEQDDIEETIECLSCGAPVYRSDEKCELCGHDLRIRTKD